MPNEESAKGDWWKWLKGFWNHYTSLIVIIAAALLLEMTTGALYYSAQNIIQRTMQRLVEREMNAIYLCIRNKLVPVEVTTDNMAWVVSNEMAEADSLFAMTRRLVEHNPTIQGCGISCIPDYYPKKGHWFEPYSVRREDGTIETMQLGSADHDYTKSEFFTVPMANGNGHWCEPYMDNDGAKAMVTSYGVPVREASGRAVAVVGADISLGWLDVVMNESKVYESTRRFLVTGSHNLLAGEDGPVFKAALELLKADSDRNGYYTLKDEKDGKLHVFYTPVGGKTDWVLINVLKDGDVFGKLRQMRVLLLLPVMIGLFFAGFIVYRSSRNLERLRKVNAEQDRISSELRVASQIQQSMLPGQHLHQDDVDICGSLVPAREVGGDIYDFFIRDEKLFFCIGDVSGKGTPSAILMGVIHSFFHAFSAHENNPAHIMQSINEASCRGNDSNMFVTLFIGVLDLPTGHLRYCDAGHDAPVVLHSGRLHSTLPVIPHLPVGVFDDIKYGVQETLLQPDSTLFLYTDGLTEAMNEGRKQFGLQRAEEVLGHCAEEKLTPQQILERVTDELHRFVGDAKQSDDLTLLAIRYTPIQRELVLDEQLTLQNDLQQVTLLNSFVKQVMSRLNVEKSLARELQLAVEEAVVNVIEYAYPIETKGDVIVKMMSDGCLLKIMIIDAGVFFDPTAKAKTDLDIPVQDRQIGGLGILLVRELMDSINYEREDGKNILTLSKNLKP